MVDRRIASVLAVLFLACGDLPIHAQEPNLSGVWTLDRAASDFTAPAFSGGRGGAHIERLFITHATNGTIVIGPETNGLKAWSYTPGRERSIPVGRGTTMTAESRWEGARLVVEGRQAEMQMHEVMSLSADGEVLTIRVTTTTPGGQSVNRLVYEKGRPLGPCKSWAMPCKEFPEFDAQRR